MISEAGLEDLVLVGTLCGTRQWSQMVSEAAGDPLADQNAAYALHFYAGTHGAWLQVEAQAALNAGAALFASEWGAAQTSGDGTPDGESTAAWMSFLNANSISHCNWALDNEDGDASALVPGSDPSGAWLPSDLTDSGLFVSQILARYAENISGSCDASEI